MGLPLLEDGNVGIDGDNWEVGFTLGLLWEPADDLRFGLRYRSEMDHELEGDLTVISRNDVKTGLTLPQSLTLSAYHDINEKVAIMGDVGWTDWSVFDRTVINVGDPTLEIARDWDDVWNIGLGVHIRPAERWLAMAGVGFTTSAVNDADRTPDLPVDQQFRISTGVEYQVDSTWRVGANFTYLNLGENDIDQSRGPFRIRGDYDAAAYIIGVYASFTF